MITRDRVITVARRCPPSAAIARSHRGCRMEEFATSPVARIGASRNPRPTVALVVRRGTTWDVWPLRARSEGASLKP